MINKLDILKIINIDVATAIVENNNINLDILLAKIQYNISNLYYLENIKIASQKPESEVL